VFLCRHHHLPRMDHIALLLHQIPVQKMHLSVQEFAVNENSLFHVFMVMF